MSRRYTLFNQEKTETVSNLFLSITHPSGYSLNNKEVATGYYDAHEEKWVFECTETMTKRWLELVFSQSVNVVGGQLKPTCYDFVTYVRDIVMPRKGLALEIKEKEPQNK